MPNWNRSTFINLFMILFLNALYIVSSSNEESTVWIAFALKTGLNLNPWTTISWPSSENASIINLFLPCFYLLFLFCVSQIQSGLLSRHKLEYAGTIVLMRFSFAGNFGLLFRTVDTQTNVVQHIYEYSMVQSWYLFGEKTTVKIRLLWPLFFMLLPWKS